jgi:hypothetical protein
VPRRTFPLVGPDVLLIAYAGTRANNAIFVVECEGSLDAAQVEAQCRELAAIAPFTGARVERPFPWGRLRWVVGEPDVRVVSRCLEPGASIGRIAEDELNAAIDPWRGPALRWTIVNAADGRRSWLLLTWVHSLMDPRGAELLVTMLDAVARGGEERRWAAEQLIVPPLDRRPLRERLQIARRGFERLRLISERVPHSLGRHVSDPGRVRFRRHVVPAGSPRSFPITLGHVATAVAQLYRNRGIAQGPFILPISVDRRRKGEPGPVFSNYLSFHFICLAPEHIGDVAATAAAVRREMAEALRADAIEGLWEGMELGCYYPIGWMLRSFEDDIASFHCADLGEARPIGPTLMNAPVRGAYHVACVQPRPGLGIFFNRAAGYENIIVTWVERVIEEREIDAILGHLLAAFAPADAA